MCRYWLPVAASMVLLMPTNGKAQAVSVPEPPPAVTAANVDWQMRGAPIFYASNFYWPSGPTIFFNGAVMVRTGTYEGVPLYTDPFLPAFSVVYVPVGDDVMRPYVRRAPEAGHVGRVGAPREYARLPPETHVVPEGPSGLRPIGTIGLRPGRLDTDRETPAADAVDSRGRVLSTAVPPHGKDGIWIAFNETRYYHSGPAVTYAPSQFVPIGTYRGFPVYRERDGRSDEIFVAVTAQGPLAPYRR